MTDERQYVLLADDESAITEALSCTLERAGRTVILCSDLDAAEVALSHFPITHLVTDVQFSDEFGFEGLHFLGRVRARSPQCLIVLMTGNATDALRRNAIHHGAFAVLAKPFATEKLEEALAGRAARINACDAAPYEVIRIPSIEEILGGDGLTIAFQPIVRLTPNDTTTFAYEALARVSERWLTGGPAMLFDYAERRGMLAEMNIMAMERAIEEAPALPGDAALFINIDPPTFSHSQLVPSLLRAAAGAEIALDRIVLEITERSAFTDDARLEVFDELRAAGVRFALDDQGSAYSHLSQIDRIRPSFIKISNTFGTAFEEDETKECIVRHTVALARDFGCETILEGIESTATVHAAANAGVPLAQGFYFSRACPAAHWTGSKATLRAA